MQNKVDILEKELGMHLLDYQKVIIEKTIKSKTPIYINVPPSNGKEVFLSLLTKVIRRRNDESMVWKKDNLL